MILLTMMGTWELIILILVIALGFLPTILAIIDILKNEFKGRYKIFWLLVVLFMNLFGAILYFLIGKEQKTTKQY